MNMDVTQTTLVELRNAIAVGKYSALQVTQAYLDRIERYNPQLNAYDQVLAEQALERAKQVDAGKVQGELAGVPIALKDNLCTQYARTTCSSKMLEHFHAPYDAAAVRKLHEAGAVILGKTNLDEFAMGSSTENSAMGATRNPWDVNCVPGGSSGGSAVTVAASLASAALGSDTGGSIRQPAALCGVVGLKPTYGRVSRHGLIAFASSLDQIGPLTRSVQDAALLLQVIAGHDAQDSTSANAPVPDYLAQVDKPVKNLRIGIAKQYLSDQNHEAVSQAVEHAKEIFQDAGAEVVQVDLPHTEYGIPTYYIVATAEASSNLARYDGIHYGHRAKHADDLVDLYARSRSEGFGPEVKRRIMLGTYALSSGYYDAYYLRAQKVRRLIKRDFDQAFETCDVILCPTTTSGAFRFGDKSDDPLAMYLNDVYTVNANLAGIPGLSLPGGFTSQGQGRLPVGIQLLGPAFSESLLLRLGHMYQQATNYHQHHPDLTAAE
jgi:aspartyl-tRNA(Asn)/glutamyl-tRNA(Gln) amidotransferase subunit A